MAGVGLARKRWNPRHSTINSSHPMAVGLVGCWVGQGAGLMSEKVSRTKDPRTFITKVPGPVAPYGRSYTNGAIEPSTSSGWQITPNFRCFTFFVAGVVGPLAAELVNEANITDLFGRDLDAGSTPFFRFGDGGVAEGRMQFVIGTSKLTSTVTLAKGNGFTAFARSYASNADLYVNGTATSLGLPMSSGSATFAPGFNSCYTGASRANRYSAHTISIAAVWDYPLPDGAVPLLMADPFCMLKG